MCTTALLSRARTCGKHLSHAVYTPACSPWNNTPTEYAWAAGALSFSKLGGGKSVGAWIPAGDLFSAHCELHATPDYKSVPKQLPPTTGTDVYRVTVSSKLGATFRSVDAGAVHTPIIG